MAKVTFNDLSGALKTAIVLLWLIIGLNALAFLVGFIAGVLSW
ncbi:MAG: hypothetical protein ACTSU6_06745 [Candidatus Njordarchaeales archaeon]